MTSYKLIIGPDPIFKKPSSEVENIDGEIRALCADLRDLLYNEGAIGVAATMVGVLKRVIVVDLQENSRREPLTMINPSVKVKDENKQCFEEASICFPGISAQIERPRSITVSYLDEEGVPQVLNADGFLATVIQHEIDYLDGRIFLDYLSPLKRSRLLKKFQKIQRNQSG